MKRLAALTIAALVVLATACGDDTDTRAPAATAAAAPSSAAATTEPASTAPAVRRCEPVARGIRARGSGIGRGATRVSTASRPRTDSGDLRPLRSGCAGRRLVAVGYRAWFAGTVPKEGV
jgi:hypothetical protein